MPSAALLRSLLLTGVACAALWTGVAVAEPQPEVQIGAESAGLALAAAFDERGVAALEADDRPAAAAFFEKAVELRRRLAPGTDLLKLALSHLGVAYNRLGRLGDARKALEEGLAIARRLDPDGLREASLRNNLGKVTYELGDMVAAEEHLRRSKELRERLAPESLPLAQSLNNLGALMRSLGELEKAEVWYRQALELRRRLDPQGETVVTTLVNLAILLEQRGAGEAVDLAREAVALATAGAPGGDAEAWAQKTLAHVLLGQRPSTAESRKAAVEAARRSVEVHRRLADVSTVLADALMVLGRAHLAAGELEDAGAAFEEALELCARLAPDSRWEAGAWHALADLERRRGADQTALGHELRAIELAEAASRPAGETPRELARAAAESVEWYRTASLAAARLGRLETAFDLTERARARGLHAALAERRLAFGRDLPAAVETRRQQLAARYESAWGRLEAARSRAELTAAQEELTELRDARQSLERSIRQVSPRLAELRRPSPATARQVSRELPSGTLLLSWIVGEESSLVLALLGGAGRSDAAEDPAAPVAGLAAYPLAVGRAELASRLDTWRALLEQPSPGSEPAHERLARGLWEDLLSPLETQLAAARRVVVMPDRSLRGLPFAALRDGAGRYLVERMPISRAPSATVALRRAWRPVDPRRPLVVFADPEPNGRPLPWSRLEAEALAGVHPGPSRVRLGEAAAENAFKAVGQDAGFLHFAGHAEIVSRFPMDSFLRLADGDGEDGLLRTWEIFQSLRIDAELVTLSSCRADAETTFDGQGLDGLTQAFVFAGARAVVSSHWQVRDRPTALLMIRFYKHLARGRDLDQALRQAQLDLLLGRTDGSEVDRSGWLGRLRAWTGLGAATVVSPGLEHPNRWAAFELMLGR